MTHSLLPLLPLKSQSCKLCLTSLHIHQLLPFGSLPILLNYLSMASPSPPNPLHPLGDPISSPNFFSNFNPFINLPKKGETFLFDLHLSNALDSLIHNLVVFDGTVKGRKKGSVFFGFAKIRGLPPIAQGNSKVKELSVQEFVQCSTVGEGRQFFDEMDSNKVGKARLKGLEIDLSKRRLPERNKPCEDASAETVTRNVLKSALAGGIACSFSAFVMHPVDTVKTCVQASTLSLPELISKIPEFGLRGLYKGSIPAVLGQFSSHGLRTGICEASKSVLIKAVPGLPEIRVQSIASLCSTILGTTARVPCEVLKQRLQAGLYDNVIEATVCAIREDGIKGFFRGTGAMLCREVPFYVVGMGFYEETKKAVQKLLRRNLEPWETIVVGAVTGGLTSVLTTPFDVIKTRMMIGPQGVQLSMQTVAFAILREEGPLALFRGAVPRFCWVAPLGAMNFAGYELLKAAMDKAQLFSGSHQHGMKDSQ